MIITVIKNENGSKKENSCIHYTDGTCNNTYSRNYMAEQ